MDTHSNLIPCRAAWLMLGFVSSLLPTPYGAPEDVAQNIPVAVTPAMENEPEVAALGDQLVAVWFSYHGTRTRWGYSINRGQTWTAGDDLPVHDPSTQVSTGQPSICVDGQGNFFATTVLESYGASGLAAYRGSFQGASFVWELPVFLTPFAEPPYVDSAYDFPRVACDRERGYVYLAYTRTPDAFGELEHTIEFMRSLDRGVTWSAPVALSGNACTGARLAVGPDGELYVVWVNYATGNVVGRKSLDFGASFGPEFTVGQIHDNWGMSPPGWTPNYVHTHPISYFTCGAVNAPALAVDKSLGPRRGALYAVWTDHVTGSLSPSSGTVVGQEPNGFYGNATPIMIGQDGSGFIQSADRPPFELDCDIFTFEAEAGTTIWISTLAQAMPYNPRAPVAYGLSCGRDTTRLDGVACNYLELLGGPRMAPLIYTLPATGRYYLNFGCNRVEALSYGFSLRSLSPGSGGAALDHRDVVLTASFDGGESWTPKVRVNDDPPRHENTFPEVAVDDQGLVHVVWYDRRNTGECGVDGIHTYWTRSDDGGQSFRASVRLSERGSIGSSETEFGWRVGDHLALEADGGRVYVLWTETGYPTSDIYGVIIEGEPPTGIAVGDLAAEVVRGVVKVRWRVSEERGLVGFRVHRAEGEEEEEEFEPLGELIPVRGEGEYEWEDREVVAGQIYRYRLEVVRAVGGADWEGPVAVEVPGAVPRLALSSAAPNPFSAGLMVQLLAPSAGELRVVVYGVSGGVMRVLHQGLVPAGEVSLGWDGRDQRGRRVAAGVYHIRAELAGEVVTRRVVSVR